MRQTLYTIESNRKIAEDIYELVLSGDTSAFTAPGQFAELKVEGCFLRRPISVCLKEDDRLTLIYKTVGKGTEILSEMKKGQTLDALTGLGNGFDLLKSGNKPLLVGGGVGVPPMFFLCKKLLERGKLVTVVLGFSSDKDVFYEEKFEALGAKVYVATADGSRGRKGFVTDLMQDLDYTYFYACGPMPMFRAMEKIVKTGGQYSLEERMGCGFGACMGCTCKTLTGSKRICKEGPVFEREEIIWEALR